MPAVEETLTRVTALHRTAHRRAAIDQLEKMKTIGVMLLPSE